MTTQLSTIGIIDAPLAAIDRRSLSQAWYSALHLAKAASSGQACSPKVVALFDPQRASIARGRSHSETSPRTLERARVSRLHQRRTAGATAAPERRSSRSVLSLRIERALATPAHAPKRITIALENDGARVHLIVQSMPSGLRVVALCPARVEATVAKALAQARFALARRGIEVDA